MNTSDVQREIRDLEVFGGVGEHQLNWTRTGHSRLANGARWFGDGHVWRHSYQWEMVDTGTNQVEITYPDGNVNDYTLSGGMWTSLASNPDLLTQSGSSYYLQRPSGFVYHFVQISNGAQAYYQLQDFRDSIGNAYVLTYDASNRLALITEPAGRWLRITYQQIPVNQQQFNTLYAQTSTPTAGWHEVTVNDPTAYRYLRYYSTDPGAVESHSDIAEIEFYDTAGNKLSGTVFGSTPSSNGGFDSPDKAFDGNTGTWYEFQSPHFGFVGIDLGANNAKAVGKIRFYPRDGDGLARMNGTNPETNMPDCRFEGSNAAPVTETVITKVEAGYGSGSSQVVTRNVQYVYATIADPVLATGWLVLKTALYGDRNAGQYTYQSLYAGQRPLLYSADDPRMMGQATNIRYEFWQQNGNVYGEIYAEHDRASDQILAKFEGGSNISERKITYANGAVRRVVMGIDSNVVSRTDALGNQTAFTYAANGSGFLQAVTDPLHHTTSYTRDTQGRLLSATYADNSTESWTLDALGHVLTHTDGRGNVTTWTRDTNGRATRVDYPDGGNETFTYNSFGQTLTHRQINGGNESFAYDGRGMMTSWTDALNHVTTYGYNGNDLLVSVQDPLNHTTTYARNERGQVTQATYADNTSTSYSYDTYGNQVSATNELGKTWSATFDAYNRKITDTDPLNRTTQYWYDEPGASGCGSCGSGLGGTQTHLTTLVLPSGKTTKFQYDQAWHRTSVTRGYNTSDAATQNFSYDAAGNLKTSTDPRSKVTTYTYDACNYRTSATDPLNNVTQWTYDAAGNLLTEVRPDNGITTYGYDTRHRRTKVTDPLSQVTQMAYNPSGTLLSLTDGRNSVYSYSYDLRNREVRTSYPDGSHEDWTYDAAGNTATYTNRAGQVLTGTFDARNRGVDAVWNDGSTPEVTTTYNAAGQVLTLNNRNSALSYAYDDAGELSSETQNITNGPGAKTVSYSYDADRNRSGLNTPDGPAVSYTYTARNQPASVTAGQSPALVTYTYNPDGKRTSKVLENGVTTTYGYDDADRLTSLAHAHGNTVISSFAYAYNSVDDRTSVTRQDGYGDAYAYDAIDRVTGVQYGVSNPANSPANPQSTQTYAYDAVGNRTSLTQSGGSISYSTNSLNEYTQVGGITQQYDGNGNRLVYGNNTDSYDAQNRLTIAQIKSQTGSQQASTNSTVRPGPINPNPVSTVVSLSTAYDARNRPVMRQTNDGSTPTYFVYDGWSLVGEYAGSTLQYNYVHGSRVDEILMRVDGNSSAIYYQHDGLGSTVALTDGNAQLLERYNYDVFGLPTITNAAGSNLDGSSYANRFLFTGREFLATFNLYDYRNRMYAPDLGRFLQTDPIRFAAGDVNIYGYVVDSPTDATDAFGLEPGTAGAPGRPGVNHGNGGPGGPGSDGDAGGKGGDAFPGSGGTGGAGGPGSGKGAGGAGGKGGDGRPGVNGGHGGNGGRGGEDGGCGGKGGAGGKGYSGDPSRPDDPATSGGGGGTGGDGGGDTGNGGQGGRGGDGGNGSTANGGTSGANGGRGGGGGYGGGNGGDGGFGGNGGLGIGAGAGGNGNFGGDGGYSTGTGKGGYGGGGGDGGPATGSLNPEDPVLPGRDGGPPTPPNGSDGGQGGLPGRGHPPVPPSPLGA